MRGVIVEELDFKTFDLVEVLSGRSYPEDTFPVYFDEGRAYQVTKVGRELDRLNPKDEGFDEKQQEWLGLVDDLRKSAYKVTVKGVPSYVDRNIVDTIREKHDLKIGAELSGSAYEEYMVLKWTSRLVRMEDPNGAVIAPLTEEMVKALRDNAPEFVQRQIEEAISALEGGVRGGFEVAASETDFLSSASPEA